MSKPLTLDQHLCFSLYSASIAINRTYKPMLDTLGITYPQYLVLSTLWEEDGRTISAIAERLALEPSTVTPLVKRLEAAGFVSRRRNEADERQVLATLTAQGRAIEEQSRCLGETLIAASGMSHGELSALNETVKGLRDTLAAQKPLS